MNAQNSRLSILIADDSKEDRHLMSRAFQEAQVGNPLEFVKDGQELLDFLRRPNAGPLPALVLVDLNMPRVDGREALQAIRADPRLAAIPVLVLSTSNHELDVLSSYRLGANAVMVKPMSFVEFVDLVMMLKRFWLEHVQLPPQFYA